MQWRLPALAAALWAIIFAVIGTVVGLLIHGLVGALLGAIFGLLATAVVGFLPSIRDAALRRQRELHELEGQVETAQAAWDAVGEPMPGGGELAALLRPDRAAVEFTGRDSELEALRGWCSSDEAGSVRVISGPVPLEYSVAWLTCAVADSWTW